MAQHRRESTLVRLRGIVQEVEERGGTYRSELHLAERIKADSSMAAHFDMEQGALQFHSVVVHFENDSPIHVEDRHVNATIAPDYLDIDFRTQTADEFLLRAAALQRVEFVIVSRMPTVAVSRCWQWTSRNPASCCGARPFRATKVASVATMWHPWMRYRFSGRI